MVESRSWGAQLGSAARYLFLVLLSVTVLIPLVNQLAISFSDRAATAAGFVAFWPVGFNLFSYHTVISSNAFWSAALISVERTLLGTGLQMALTILTAYPLSRTPQEFKGRTIFIWILLIALLFNGGLIPLYLVVRSLGLLDTIWALVLPTALPLFNVILLVNFFRGVPKELEEAAYIDGASHWRILWHVYLPLSLPALATLTLFSAVGHWNSWFDGMIYMSDPTHYPLQTYLRTVVIGNDLSQFILDPNALAFLSDRSIRAAQIFITIIPILAVYPFLQRYFIAGIKLGSVKG
jgi:putative aldouronate transport system permease protein